MSDSKETTLERRLSRWECLQSALLDAQAAVDALRRGEPLAADVYLKLAIDYIRESGVLP
jgi:hypothetical protein